MDETKEKKPYKLNMGDIITVYREDVEWKGKKLRFFKTYYNLGNEKYFKTLYFKKGIADELENNTKIRILDFFETARHIDKFRDEWNIMILDYEVVEMLSNAVDEYEKQIENSDYEINDEDILF